MHTQGNGNWIDLAVAKGLKDILLEASSSLRWYYTENLWPWGDVNKTVLRIITIKWFFKNFCFASYSAW